MASKPVAFLLADLGVTKTHNRPHCSNDNPYSNAHFRTLKYLPSFPARFGPYRRFAGDRATVTVGWCAREPRSEVGTEFRTDSPASVAELLPHRLSAQSRVNCHVGWLATGP